ncbi:MAG: hypothetical protein AAGB48_09765 [Planctomycetota bacterium]
MPLPVEGLQVRPMYVTSLGRVSDEPFEEMEVPTPAPQGSQCQEVSVLPSEGFEGGTYFVQAGFVENEIAAVSYTLDASLFPIRIDLIEALIGTGPSGTSVPTTTEYTILVWDGTPATGTLLVSVSSDGDIIPHVQLPALSQAQAVNVNFLVDPGDPEQIFVNNISGTNTFSVGIRIDEHNNQIGNGCFPAPSQTANAFPMTDTDGANQTQNWIRAIDCGPLGCPPGWSSFAQFPPLCTPSGDWMIRATWTSFTCSDDTGACCEDDGSCSELTQSECVASGGDYQGDGTTCAGVTCPLPTGACCLSNDNCLLLDEAACDVVSGAWQGAGSACNGSACPRGAACLPDGTCVAGVTEFEAEQLDGVYLGNDTTCADADCPQPLGACCVTTSSACLVLNEADCGLVPNAVWLGAGSICDSNGDGIPGGGCIPPKDCPGDVNGDGTVNDSDYFAWVTAFIGDLPECDVNGDENCSDSDYFAWVTAFIGGC